MLIVDKSGKTELVILGGTEHELRFDWPTGECPPGPWGAKVYTALRKLRNILTQANPQSVPLVDGILLGWVYTSMETQRLRDENLALEKRLRSLEHTMKNVESFQRSQAMGIKPGLEP